MPNQTFPIMWRGYLTLAVFCALPVFMYLSEQKLEAGISNRFWISIAFIIGYIAFVGFPFLRISISNNTLVVEYLLMPFRNQRIPLDSIGSYRITEGKNGSLKLFDREGKQLVRFFHFYDFSALDTWLRQNSRHA